jgi:hypothetical protein
MDEAQAPTKQQIDESKKVIKKSIEWMFNWLKDGSFLLEEREDILKCYEALSLLINGTEEAFTHETNKSVRHGLAWIHYKLGVTPIKHKSLDDAMIARGILFTICTDLQKKIDEVEPPAVKPVEAPKGPYVMDLPMGAQATQ